MKEYYDALYRENEHYWGRLPSPLSLLALGHCRKGRVLDLGAGQGPDAIYFASKGLSVVALDVSPIAIAQLREHAKSLAAPDAPIDAHGTAIDVREQDMRELPKEEFDIVFSRMALQMIEPAQRKEYIEELKRTYPKALHVHVVPISGACFGDAFICGNDLLKSAYEDWDVLFYEEAWTIGRALNRNGEPYLMREARIIARKTT